MAILPHKLFPEWLIIATPIPDLCAYWLSNGSAPLSDSSILEGVAHLRDMLFLYLFALIFEARRQGPGSYFSSYLRQPLPTLAQLAFSAPLAFQPKRLQRFLRGIFVATGRSLVTPPGSVYLDKNAQLNLRCIFARVMSGFVSREEMQLQAAAAARIAGKCGIIAAARRGAVADVLSFLIARANCVNERDG